MKETSLLTYKKVVDSGLLSRQKLKVFEWFCEFAPCTVNELIAQVGRRYKEAFREPVHINKIPSFLEKHNLIYVYDSRNCRKTGNPSEVWNLTFKNPIKLEPRKSKEVKKREILILLRDIKAYNFGQEHLWKKAIKLVKEM